MELRDLQTFVAVAEAGGFRGGANTSASTDLPSAGV